MAVPSPTMLGSLQGSSSLGVKRARRSNLDKKPNTLDGCPLDAEMQANIEASHLKFYNKKCLRTREFMKQFPSVFRVSRVRSRTEGSMAQPTKRQRIREYLSLEFAEVGSTTARPRCIA